MKCDQVSINIISFILYVLKVCTSYDMHGMKISADDNKICRLNDGNTNGEWKMLPTGRRSVHEMIKRFQQVPNMHNGWRGIHSGNSELTSLDDRTKCLQNQGARSQGDMYILD